MDADPAREVPRDAGPSRTLLEALARLLVGQACRIDLGADGSVTLAAPGAQAGVSPATNARARHPRTWCPPTGGGPLTTNEVAILDCLGRRGGEWTTARVLAAAIS